MIETPTKQQWYQPEAAARTREISPAQEIASTVLSLGKLAADFTQITRIPRHADGRHENDSEHTFMLTLVAPAVAEKHYPDLDLDKIRRFAHVHDFPELITGDINTHDSTPEELDEKARRDREAAQQLLTILPSSLATALEEYERQDTPEAVFVRVIDKLLPTAMGIIGDGPHMVREDFGISEVEALTERDRKVRQRLHAISRGNYEPLIGAHALLCTAFEDQVRNQLERADNVPKTPERTFEVERKYLIDLERLLQELDLGEFNRVYLRQGYIALGADGSETRIRSFDDERFELTVKTPGMIERGVRTITISRELFDGMWKQTEGRQTEKTRYYIPYEKYTIELDVYNGHLAGLATAEVEFDGRVDDAHLRATTFTPPNWLGADISEDPRYKNRNLAQSRPHDLSKLYMNL